jgi:hypothetical protein
VPNHYKCCVQRFPSRLRTLAAGMGISIATRGRCKIRERVKWLLALLARYFAISPQRYVFWSEWSGLWCHVYYSFSDITKPLHQNRLNWTRPVSVMAPWTLRTLSHTLFVIRILYGQRGLAQIDYTTRKVLSDKVICAPRSSPKADRRVALGHVAYFGP